MRGLKFFIVVFFTIIFFGCAAYSGNAFADERDPLKSINKPIFAINDAIDSVLFKPLAIGYGYITPQPVQNSVANFFLNLNEIDNLINNLLQGKPNAFAVSLGRLTINTSIGIGGLFDVASTLGLTHVEEDFGQTLGFYGADAGPYIVLPLLGPTSARDLPGRVVSMMLNPLSWLDNVGFRNILIGVNVIDTRENFLGKEDVASEISKDKYTLYKDIYLDKRMFNISDGKVNSFDLTSSFSE